ncbi:MAG: 8-amino-7-oxononanoate synthase [Candidatus Margulisbacteria bacterium]|nr:8-amino-7-oxononanoate synthase [Candidatus Margulisiibacteriota bacterium]
MRVYEDFLEQRRSAHTLRTLTPISRREKGRVLIEEKWYWDFASNDYLGLSQHPELIQGAADFLKIHGMGSTGSRLLSGDHDVFHALETDVARWRGTESALVFNSGYQANIGILAALLGPGDVVFVDRLSHASLLDGILQSGARFFRFRHQDMGHLEALLSKYRAQYKQAWIVTETVFSMDGDIVPIDEVDMLKKKFNASLFLDESHAVGVLDVRKFPADILVGTFGKALGGSGAYVACSELIKTYLIQTARSFIYSTAFPPVVAEWNRLALACFYGGEAVLDAARGFRNRLRLLGFQVLGETHIVPVLVGATQDAVALSERLKSKGYWVPCVRPPTVEADASRLRFSVTAWHTSDLLKEVADVLA